MVCEGAAPAKNGWPDWRPLMFNEMSSKAISSSQSAQDSRCRAMRRLYAIEILVGAHERLTLAF